MAASIQQVLVVLKIQDGGAKNLQDITVTVKTKSGDEIPVLKLLEPNDMATSRNMVQEVPVGVEAVSDEPSGHVVTRKASSASKIVKSPTLKDAVRPMTAINDIDSVTVPQDIRHDDNDVTTISHQPAEEQDAIYMYFSVTHSSLHNKGNETMDINGPFCEGLSGCVDDYSDYSTNEAEEGSYCLSTFVPVNYYMPENPQPIVVEESPLVFQDEALTVSIPNTSSSGSSGQYAVCHTEVAAAATSKMVVAADEEVVTV